MRLPESRESRARRVMCARMSRMLLAGDTALGGRDAAVLLKHKFIRRERPELAPDSLKAGVDAQIAEGTGGPLLFFVDASVSKRSVWRVADLVVDASRDCRLEAMCLLTWLASTQDVLSPKSRAAITGQLGTKCQQQTDWLDAALEIHDCLGEDWLFALSGLAQSLAQRFDQGASDYLAKALAPEAMTLLQSGIPVPRPDAANTASVEPAVTGEVAHDSLTAIIAVHLANHRHVPPAAAQSLGSAIAGSTESGPVVWQELWKLATSNTSLLARYHACEALLANPAIIPAEQVKALADMVWDIVLWSVPAEGRPLRAAWRVLHCLAAHFVRYTELFAPISDGERLAEQSWWMADEVVSVLLSADIDCDRLLPHIERHAVDGVSCVWEVVRPRYGPSALRTTTLDELSPWAVSLLSRLSIEATRRLVLNEGATGEELLRRKTLMTCFVQTRAHAPFGVGSFLFESAKDLATATAAVAQSEGETELVNALAPGGRAFIPDGLPELLAAVRSGCEPLNLWAAGILVTRARCGHIDPGILWKEISGAEWRDQVWPALDFHTAQHVLVAALEIAVQARPEWAIELPHLIAGMTEQHLKNGTDAEALFGLTIQAACALHAGSAVRRLLRHPEGYRLRSAAERFRANALLAAPYGGMWASGHLRATVVEMAL